MKKLLFCLGVIAMSAVFSSAQTRDVWLNGTPSFVHAELRGDTRSDSGSDDRDRYIHPTLAADGVTSDDEALAKAAEACDEAGTKLILPAGRILLTGAKTIRLNHCAMVGVGAPAADKTGDYGTTILLTSETVSPFQLETGWLISGVNFYWPDQTTGTTVYPPLFVDGGKGHGFAHGVIDNIVIVNAYDGMTTTPGGGSGDVKISNSTMWAFHYLFNLTNTGDSWALSNNRFTPGPLLGGKCNHSAACVAAINEANHVNAIFHLTEGPPVTLVVNNTETFSWRYGILIDSGGKLGASIFNVAWDGMGTLIDSSSGGIYAFQNQFTGSMSQCGIVVYGGASHVGTSCFNLGPGSGLFLHDFLSGGSSGDWLVCAGNDNISINNVSIAGIGRANDGKDYHVIDFKGPSNLLTVQNSLLQGQPSSVHAHGINLGSNAVIRTIVQNTIFNFLDDSITGTVTGRVVLTGNTSFNTSKNGKSVQLKGTGNMVYGDNFWDVPPTSLLPTITN